MRRHQGLSAKQAWKLLGIEPCDDERAVKRAYAAKLKSINPDEDVEGFGRLRLALKSARQDARWRKELAERGDAVDDDFDEDDIFLAPADTFIPADAVAAAISVDRDLARSDNSGEDLGIEDDGYGDPGEFEYEPAEPDPTQIKFRELNKLLISDYFSASEQEQALELLDQILSDERIDEIAYAERVEGALADLLVYTTPNSDNLIRVADKHFNWRAEMDAANPRWRVYEVARRADDLAAIDAMADPEHRWHEAYNALIKGPPRIHSLADRLRLQPVVRELIASLRHHHPDLEAQFNPEILDRWAEAGSSAPPAELIRSEGISWYGWVLIFYLVWQVLYSAFGVGA